MEIKEYTLEEVKSEANVFLNIKKSNNNTTYLNYRTSIRYFIYYLEDIVELDVIGTKNIGIVLEGFQGALLTGFNYNVNGNERTVKVKASGTNTHLRRIRTFLNKCLGLTTELKPIKVKNKSKYKALKEDEIQLLLDEVPNKWKKEEIVVRNSCLIKFLYNTAFRISEALSLTVENLYTEKGDYYVKVHEKGTAKEELSKPIRISKEDYDSLQHYIEIKKVPSDYVFSTTKASDNGKAKALTRQYFNKDVKALTRYVDAKHKTNLSEIVDNNSSHVFRHSKAHTLLNRYGVSLVEVMKFLRHDNISSTQIYLDPEDEAIDELRTKTILK